MITSTVPAAAAGKGDTSMTPTTTLPVLPQPLIVEITRYAPFETLPVMGATCHWLQEQAIAEAVVRLQGANDSISSTTTTTISTTTTSHVTIPEEIIQRMGLR